jgi:uncharacterized protein involved in exopolysaccharide biosynthesis
MHSPTPPVMQYTLSDPTPAAPSRNSLLLSTAKNWRLFRNCIILGVLIAIGVRLALGRRYSTTAAIFPQPTRSSQLSGLAAQFGLDLGANDATESPYFYADLLRTSQLLTGVVTRRYTAAGKTQDFAGFAGITTADSAARTEKAIKELLDRFSVSPDRRTGIVRIRVTEKEPHLALQLANALLDGVAIYNREARQSRASAERRFVEERLRAARDELTGAEDSLQIFLTHNREFRTSPALTFQHDRLQRSVTLRATVVSSLAENFEQARLEEVRDTPVFSVVEAPHLPARPDPRGLTRAAIIGLGGGLLVAVLLQLTIEATAGLRAGNEEEYQEWMATLRDLRRHLLWR